MMINKFLKYLILLMIIILFAGFQTETVLAADQESYSGEPLCLPGAYPFEQLDCLAMGPSEFLTSMAEKGIRVPFQPLPAYQPDNSYTLAPVPYLTVGENSFPLYASLDDAIGRSPTRYLEAGFKYLAVSERVDREDGVYYRLMNGLWVEAGEANTECCIRSGRFQGLMFYQNPVNSFGWILDQADVMKSPGRTSEITGKTLYRENIVQIYDIVNADGTDWYMIGIDEWVERRKIRQFVINPIPPDGVDNNRWIEINLYEQTLGIYDNGKLVFAALIATGMDPFFTRPGLFQIYEKLERTNMSGSFEIDRSDYYYLEDVPWTLYYDEARAIHGAYWRTYFGYPQSHGCVNLSLGDSRVVFDWANVGDWVYVWDPSGETPVDESLYTAGGA
ncbi:MAG: L,D-transpeptidase [Anaerolineaceae bacterium]|nr:L,D-transpeptidase [Anaerolineaceae bacterium]